MSNNFEEPFFSVEVEIHNIHLSIVLDYVNSKGIFDATYILHEHTIHELYYIESGCMTLESNNIENVLKTGDVFIIRAKTQHRLINCSNDIQRFHIRFQFLGNTNDQIEFFNNLHIIPNSYENKYYQRLIKDIRKFTGDSINKFELYRLKANLGILFSYLFEKHTDYCLESPRNYIESIAQYNKITLYSLIDNFFYDNYGFHVTIDDLAQHLNYSRTQTQRMLESYGVNFTNKLRDMRMRAAKYYLSNNEFTITEIANKCGYSTRQSFESSFKKYTTMTPHKYRIEILKHNQNDKF